MQATIDNLETIIANYNGRLAALPEAVYVLRTSPEKWSRKEILGHLVDSAQNNLRRFIVAQYEHTPRITYQQDEWVALTGYQDYPSADLVLLWKLLNRHIVSVLKKMTPASAERKCNNGGAQPQSLEWLAADYCNHLLHHLHQVLDLEPIAYS